MGKELDVVFGGQILTLEVFDSTLENNPNLNIKEIVKRLCTFCLSKKFVPFFCSNLEGSSKEKIPFDFLIALYESKEKYLSLKIIFPLFEELKNFNINFLRQIEQFGDVKAFYCSVEFQNSLYENLEKLQKVCNQLANYFNNNLSYIKSLSNLYCFIGYLVFNDLLKDKTKVDSIFNSFFKEIQKEFFNDEELNFIIDYLKTIDSLNNTKNAKQNVLLLLNLKKYEKELTLRDIDKKFLEKYEVNLNINDKLIWIIIEKDGSKSDTKYKKIILEGKITEKEKLNYDFFEKINSMIINDNIEGISGNIFQSLFDKNKIILIININEDYLKKMKITSEEIDNKIKAIKKSFISKYNNLETYVQSENKIINLDVSYDLFIQELKDKNFLREKTKIVESKINIKQISKESFNDGKSYKSKSNEESKTNKILEEKIKRLEKELTEEKNKNKKSEKIIIDLRKELENEINKYKDLKKQIEEEKIIKKKLEKETKESFIETIIEKDKKIKELELKLSRLPFTLEEGEKLISIIFISSNQEIHCSIICKNTDEFHKIEGELYKKYPEYSENENFFLLNGKKINRYKTLEENGIKNNDKIMLNVFDE